MAVRHSPTSRRLRMALEPVSVPIAAPRPEDRRQHQEVSAGAAPPSNAPPAAAPPPVEAAAPPRGHSAADIVVARLRPIRGVDRDARVIEHHAYASRRMQARRDAHDRAMNNDAGHPSWTPCSNHMMVTRLLTQRHRRQFPTLNGPQDPRCDRWYWYEGSCRSTAVLNRRRAAATAQARTE